MRANARFLLIVGMMALFGVVGVGALLQAPREAASQGRRFEGKRLRVFVGSASQPPTEEAVRRFEELTGARLELHVGGSGEMLSQMELTGEGDVYFPGSSDYMELAKRRGVVDPATEVRIAYVLPAVNTPKGNPKGIRSLGDLAKPGVRVGIARPDTVCVGLYAVEVLERAGLSERVRKNIVTYAESCAKTVQIVATGQVDAVLGWEVFSHWEPERVETIFLPPDLVPRIGYIPAAVCRSSKEREVAQAFLEFLISSEGQAIFRKWHYLTTEEDARALATPTTPIGGEWTLPASWK